jgi:hypothetical protein
MKGRGGEGREGKGREGRRGERRGGDRMNPPKTNSVYGHGPGYCIFRLIFHFRLSFTSFHSHFHPFLIVTAMSWNKQ